MAAKPGLKLASMDEFKLALTERNNALTGLAKPLDGAALQVLWASVGCSPEKQPSAWGVGEVLDCIEKSTKFDKLFQQVKISNMLKKGTKGGVLRKQYGQFREYVAECVLEVMKSVEHLELLRRASQGRVATSDVAPHKLWNPDELKKEVSSTQELLTYTLDCMVGEA